MNLKSIKSRAEMLERQLRDLKDKIYDQEQKDEEPKLRKQYVGKYFKYRTNYSCPEKPEDYWWVYVYPHTIENGQVIAFVFDTD